ncbi:cadmium-translocating P-type ATPase [Fusobacterium animalis]|uniref:heavy metal translocating P-type ATPase n=1 Tax=Fusobacterium animalis TaxID=76859 RepID=UPI0030CDC7E4
MKKKKEVIIVISAILFVIALLVKVNLTLQLILMLIAYILVGKDTVLGAIKNVEKGDFLDEKFLMTIATLGAILIGEYPEAVAVMLFYEIGELFQGYAINKSRKSIADMMDIKPEYANVIRNNKSQKVDPDEVQIGETIEIKPGERVPLDATVVKGESTLDTSALTGESVPVEVREGANILSGCININGLIIAEVTKEYFDSTVNKVLDLVENASAKKSKSERLITRFSKIYTPIVIGLAVLLAILPPIISGEYNFRLWIFRALSFLVVSCPCAFVISVPLSFFSGIGAASRAGVLIKGGNYLEALSKVDTVVFDKTGTLTKGVFNVQKVVVLDKNIDEDKFISLVAAAESGSNHPISKSIQKYYNKEIDTNSINSIKEISGKGIEAIIDNRKILVGNEKLINIPKDISIDDIGTILYVEIDNKFAGYIVISDELKKDSKKTIKDLKDIGIKKTIMLTGDLEKVSKKVGKDLGLDEVYTNLLPQDKVSKFEEIIENKKSKGNVVFVGDGINDAPVLARADVGIAMGAMGSDAAIEAADVVIMTDEPSKIVTAIKSSKKTMKIAMQNITLAFGIKAIVLILSALGIADMWMAVFADTGVTILAVLNSFRALKIENNYKKPLQFS